MRGSALPATNDPFDQAAPAGDSEADLAAAIRRRFEPLGGVELEPLPRAPLREPPSFGEASYTPNDR
jgi:hypothetical protein